MILDGEGRRGMSYMAVDVLDVDPPSLSHRWGPCPGGGEAGDGALEW